ncbi:hypothetical protein [Andreprevotia chitinilytica]|uniref:hypothetical protein n=1 Tax=Andreprevotia chitinilytica TaxID=396808 RepID=UPI00054D968F|nr:hypothetical protein [Andreprevotia chitinilytica]
MTFLIDQYLPVFQFSERHQLLVDASPAALLDAVTLPGTQEDPWVRTAIQLREWPDRVFGKADGLKSRAMFGLHDFTPLGRDSDRELAFGLIGKFWQSDYGLVAMTDPQQFAAFNEPGVAKLVMNFSAESVGNDLEGGNLNGRRTTLRTETRVFCNDSKSHLRFTPYWWLIRPVSGLIRRRMLARIRDAAADVIAN